MLLTMAIFIQMNTIKLATESVGSTIKDNTGLKDELLNLQGKYESLYKELEQKEEKLEEVRLNAAASNETDTQNEVEIKNNQVLLGLTEVSGQGIIITLDENREVNPNEVLNISGYLIHEQDLLYIINELFNSGADAISINDQRIVTTTAIQCDGNIIRINGKMVGVPIVIKAVGFPKRMEYALARPGGYLQKMANDGVEVFTQPTENVTVPKYEGVYSYEYLTRGDV